MPFPLDSTFETRRDSGRWGDAHLVDLYCLDGETEATIRVCDRAEPITFDADDAIDGTDPVTYEALSSRVRIDRNIKFQQSLATDPLKIYFDGSRAGDDDDPIGEFTDLTWHQRAIRVRQISFDADTGATPSEPVWQWVGRMDFAQYVRAGTEPVQLVLTSQGGLFRVRGRNMKTRTHEDQQRRAPGDLFFQDLPKMVGIPLNFGKKAIEIRGAYRGGLNGIGGKSPSPHGPTRYD